jgi:hypothetical protein
MCRPLACEERDQPEPGGCQLTLEHPPVWLRADGRRAHELVRPPLDTVESVLFAPRAAGQGGSMSFGHPST